LFFITFILLNLLQKELKEQSDMVNEYGQVIENYENLVSASASGSADHNLTYESIASFEFFNAVWYSS